MQRKSLPDRHVNELLAAAATVDDPELMAKVERRVLAHHGGKTAKEWARYAKDTLKRLDPTGAARRAKAARDAADVAFYPAEDGMGDVVCTPRSKTPRSSRPPSTPTEPCRCQRGYVRLAATPEVTAWKSKG